MQLSSFRSTIFYSIEKAIKAYRRFALENIHQGHLELTINQGLLLSLIAESSNISQVEMAEILFKDYAAVTRMIELMVKHGYLVREPHPEDRRRSLLKLTPLGVSTVKDLTPIIKMNRKLALAGLDAAEQKELHRLLHKIIDNCEKH
ncbi:MarR family winged helix-turn-helix transcriptional regulator [Neolewinella persica]|uniref:MarR family winged helix-turn-helix transcriptional regulator n=1 Tax=Neolewinella persica TaxID=70998 RepID=UPI000370988D|nr:MarR family transcriptional regulator [Neolewinella persica]